MDATLYYTLLKRAQNPLVREAHVLYAHAYMKAKRPRKSTYIVNFIMSEYIQVYSTMCVVMSCRKTHLNSSLRNLILEISKNE